MKLFITNQGKLLYNDDKKLVGLYEGSDGDEEEEPGPGDPDPPVDPEPVINPAPFFIQTRGAGASEITFSGVNTIETISANSTTKFVSNIVGKPVLTVAPDLGGANVIYCNDNCGLQLDTAVPSEFLGNNPRSIYMFVKTSGNSNRNIFGYGSNASNSLVDFLGFSGGVNMSIHAYNSPALSQTPITANKWEIVRFRYNSDGLILVQIDDRKRIDGWSTLTTGNESPFRIGVGAFQPFNSGGWVYVAHFEAYPYFTTDEEDNTIVERIRSIYS